jgi:hypothetical protein
MKLSQNNLQECITLYLNDVYDYGDNKEYMLAETVLSPMKSLILESNNNGMGILLEALKTASEQDKVILDDFILYMKSL